MKPDEITLYRDFSIVQQPVAQLKSIDAEAIEVAAQRAARFSATGAFHTSLGQGPRILVLPKSRVLKGRSIPPVLPPAGAPRPQNHGEKNCSAGGVGYRPANNTSHASPRCAPREVSSFPGEGLMTRGERCHAKWDSPARRIACTPTNNTSPASPRCAPGSLLFSSGSKKEGGRP